MRNIVGYSLVVKRGRLAGRTFEYKADQGNRARRRADKLDQEYGAICASVHPVYSDSQHAETIKHPTPAEKREDLRNEIANTGDC